MIICVCIYIYIYVSLHIIFHSPLSTSAKRGQSPGPLLLRHRGQFLGLAPEKSREHVNLWGFKSYHKSIWINIITIIILILNPSITI